MYIYLISTGKYSNYSLQCLAIHKKKFSEKELNKILDGAKQIYISRGLPTNDYHVRKFEFGDILLEHLLKMGFEIKYPTGELHYGDYSQMSDIIASTPWLEDNRPDSALRIGLA